MSQETVQLKKIPGKPEDQVRSSTELLWSYDEECNSFYCDCARRR